MEFINDSTRLSDLSPLQVSSRATSSFCFYRITEVVHPLPAVRLPLPSVEQVPHYRPLLPQHEVLLRAHRVARLHQGETFVHALRHEDLVLVADDVVEENFFVDFFARRVLHEVLVQISSIFAVRVVLLGQHGAGRLRCEGGFHRARNAFRHLIFMMYY